MENYHLFDTAIGLCGVAWSREGVTQVQLPEANRNVLTRRLENGGRRNPTDDLPRPIDQAVASLKRYFSGEGVDFSDLPLDLSACSPFHRSVYDATRSIPWGRTSTYGEIARRLGSPHAARAVGHALSRNPAAIIVPCHRVLAAGGKIGGFSAYGGIDAKERLLEREGLRAKRLVDAGGA